MAHSDIRIGTIINFHNPAGMVRQILSHGFESFSIMGWQTLPDNIDLDRTAASVLEAVGDKAVISTIGVFGNILTDERARTDFARCIDVARKFNCDMVSGFAGGVSGKPFEESMPLMKKIWGDLAKRAADNGLRIAWENCPMGSTWNSIGMNLAYCAAAWEAIFNELPDSNLGLQWEPCHHILQFVDPLPQLRKWLKTGRVFNIHGKDATIAWDVVHEHGIQSRHPWGWHRTPGFGETNWTDVISILRQAGFRGTIDIEGWHDPVYVRDLEMTGQVFALNYLKQCRGGPFVPNPK